MKEHKNLKLKCAVERFASRLLRPHADQGAMGSLELPHAKCHLASLLAKTPETLSRAFNTLKPSGVEVDGSTVRLKDVPAMTSMAKPNPLIDGRTT